MKSRCRWKSGRRGKMITPLGTRRLLGIGVVFLTCLICPSLAQGNRGLFTSPGQSSILPGGFQAFGQNPNFFTPPRGVSTARSGGGATSVQNTHFGFFPSSGPSSLKQPPPPSFVELGSINVNNQQNQAQHKDNIQYEYYDEPEDEVIYQYPTDLSLNNNNGKNNNKPSSAVVGKGIAVLEPNHHHHTRFPQQTFTTAQLGPSRPITSRGRGSPPTAPSAQQFIPLEEPEQPLLSLNGRSVPAPSRNSGGNNIRPPPSLLRQSAQPITPGSTTTSTTAGTSTTERSRGRLVTATTRRPVPNPGRSRFNPGTTSTTTTTTTVRSKELPGRFVLTPSSSSRPEVGRGGHHKQGHKNKENSSSHKYEGDDYTVEYIEYPESGSPEDASSAGGGKGGFDYYEVSEETAKAILKERNSKTTPKPKSDHKLTSSTIVSKSSSSSVATSTTSVISSTTPAPLPPVEKKAKVVVSVSSSKTVSGSVSKSPKVTPAPPSTTTTTTTNAPATSSTTTTLRSTTEPGHKDSIPAGAETSPEYYEEEYSYHEQQQNQPHSPKTTKSSPAVRETEEEDDVTEERHEEHEPEEAEALRHPTPRKLPSKKGEIIPHSRFQTLVDIGDLNSEGRISLRGDSNDHGHENGNEEEEVQGPQPKSTTEKPTFSLTTEAPKIYGGIKFVADISPDLLPPGFTFPPNTSVKSTTPAPTTSTSTSTTTTTTTTPTPKPVTDGPISFESVPSFLLPKGYKPLASQVTSSPSSTTSTTTTTTTSTTPQPAIIPEFSIPLNLLPKGYKLPSSTEPPPPPSSTTGLPDPLAAILSKVKFQEIDISSLIPKDYNLSPSSKPTESAIPANLLPPGFKLTPTTTHQEELPPPEIPANLLPTGYKKPPSFSPPTKKPGGPVFPTRPGLGPVFPTKPGGFRNTRPTTTEGPKADTPPPPRVTIAAGGWPTRKTTEFTGWPTPSTTRPPPTSPTPSTTTVEPVTTPSTTTKPTTTTTPPPPKRSPLGICPQEVCRMEATIRITGGVKWKPEFADINTEEYKHLEVTVKRELDGAYRASGLAPWYKRVTIEGFNQGSVLVDYFVELEGVDRELTTTDVVKVFHKSLLDSDPVDELPEDAPVSLRFGRYNIDPRYTDFKVVTLKTGKGSVNPEQLIPQWGIAVIVIGMVSLLFLLILGVIVLVSRYKNSKKKNTVSLTQEMLNEFNKSHMAVGGAGGGVDNFGADDLYNMDDVWNDNTKQMDRTFDRRPTKRSHGGSTKGSGGANYNIYDSWKTEWNGYFHSGNYYGDSGYAPSRRRSDYDTNF